MSDQQPDDVFELGAANRIHPNAGLPPRANMTARGLIIAACGAAGLALGAVCLLVPGKPAAPESQAGAAHINLENLPERERVLNNAMGAAATDYSTPIGTTIGGMHFRPDSLDAMRATVAELEKMVKDGRIKPFQPGTPPGLADTTGETREP